ncbi:MAG: hypothetical protein EOO65_01135, partial [Methanosarcinales archaeon]
MDVVMSADGSGLERATLPESVANSLSSHARSVGVRFFLARPPTCEAARIRLLPDHLFSPAGVCYMRLTHADPHDVRVVLRWLFGGEGAARVDEKVFGEERETGTSPPRASFVTIGIDAESAPNGVLTTLQLYFEGRVLLLHAPSGNFSVALSAEGGLRAVLEGAPNSLRAPHTLLTGAELVHDALDLHQHMHGVRMHAALNVSVLHPASVGDRAFAAGLKKMTNSVAGAAWEKDVAITCSNWAVPELSMEQVKYCALDAWASALMGADTVSLLEGAGCDPLTQAFSLRLAPKELLHFLKTMIQQAHKLVDAQKKAFGVPVVEIVQVEGSESKLQVTMCEFDRRVRPRFPIFIDLSHGGHDEVPMGGFAGECTRVDGRKAFIQLEKPVAGVIARCFGVSPKSVKLDTNNHAAAAIVLELSVQSLEALIYRYHCMAATAGAGAAASGAAAVAVGGVVRPGSTPSAALTSVHSTTSDGTIFEMVAKLNMLCERAWQAYILLFGSPSATSVPHDHGVAGSAATARDRHSLAAQELSAEQLAAREKAIRCHEADLNESQRNAFRDALMRRVTAIQGPPGTGKTRVIAAITEALVDCGERLVLVAPANAATRRVLESLLAAGYDDVALMVSRDFFYSWHEHVYSEQLLRHTVTPEAEDKEVEKLRKNCLWLKDDCRARNGSTVPSAVVLTSSSLLINVSPQLKPFAAGAAAGAVASASTAARSASLRNNMAWSVLMADLLQRDSITAMIVDEASQLWDGTLHRLLVVFPNLRHIILVGDEHQLPPFGEDKALCKSAFETVIARSDVSVRSLDTSYRLSVPVARILSNKLYRDKLSASRVEAVDAAAYRTLVNDACRIPERLTFARSVLERMGRDASPLLWLNMKGWVEYAKDTSSAGNQKEATQVARLAAALLVVLGDALANRDAPKSRQHVQDKRRLVVITPFQNQRRIIEKQLARELSVITHLSESAVAH